MAKYRIKTINNYVGLEMVRPPKPAADALILPDEVKKEPRWGTVVCVGPGVPDLGGGLTKPLVNPGDVVYTMAHGREVVGLGEGNVSVTSELDILAILEDLEKRSLIPLGDWVHVEKIKQPPAADDLILPDSRQAPPEWARVVRVGKGWRSYDGHPIAMQVKEGDLVAIDPYKAVIVDLSDLGASEKLFLISHGDIFGVLEETE